MEQRPDLLTAEGWSCFGRIFSVAIQSPPLQIDLPRGIFEAERTINYGPRPAHVLRDYQQYSLNLGPHMSHDSFYDALPGAVKLPSNLRNSCGTDCVIALVLFLNAFCVLSDFETVHHQYERPRPQQILMSLVWHSKANTSDLQTMTKLRNKILDDFEKDPAYDKTVLPSMSYLADHLLKGLNQASFTYQDGFECCGTKFPDTRVSPKRKTVIEVRFGAHGHMVDALESRIRSNNQPNPTRLTCPTCRTAAHRRIRAVIDRLPPTLLIAGEKANRSTITAYQALESIQLRYDEYNKAAHSTANYRPVATIATNQDHFVLTLRRPDGTFERYNDNKHPQRTEVRDWWQGIDHWELALIVYRRIY
jgi:hypothetical protein